MGHHLEEHSFIHNYNFFVQVVILRDGKYLSLKEVFVSLDLTG